MRVVAQRGVNVANATLDAIVVFQFEDEPLSASLAELDSRLKGAISSMVERKEIKGSAGEVTSILTLGELPSARVIVAGLGKRTRFTSEGVRRAAGKVTRLLRKAGIATAGIEVTPNGAVTAEEAAQAATEGVLLAAYSFDSYFSTERPPFRLEQLTFFGPADTDLEPSIRLAETLMAGTSFTRDLVNEPPNVLNPAELARRAKALAEAKGLQCEVFEPEELRRRGMNAILAVGSGSATPPRLIALHYRGDLEGRHPTCGLVGKGITFDTGGISLKPGADMHIMKTDMAGAAAMLGTMHAIADLKPALNVTALVATAENMPDGASYRPGDIIRAMNGKSIEIQNTDAEGRIVLSDALSYAVELGLSPIIDAATLTGACSVALGPYYSGLFCNDDRTRDGLLAASKLTGERLWPLPLDPDFRTLLDTSCADMRNIGGREGGAITAAMFLAEFAGDQPWAHIDIAPTAFADNEGDYYAKGLATGHPVRTLARFALGLASS
jgi:leucyl aminopeptidase